MIVNGKELSIKELTIPTIEELLKKFNINNKMIAIEINGKVIPKTEWNKIQLKEEDKIELIRFVGGG
jgi:sulfur carrier protein